MSSRRAPTFLPKRLRSLAGKAVAPVLAQGITAGTSLLLQIVAVRTLGLAEYGAFALLLALLVSVSALYTGYVGDSLAVLDRHDLDVRASLVTSALGGWSLCLITAIAMSSILRPGEVLLLVVYAAAVVCRLAGETVRRLLIARLEFWSLVGSDTCYLLVTVLVLLGLSAGAGGMSLAVLFGAMAAGALAVVGLGLVQLPSREWRGLRPGTSGMPVVASFATWRALQAGLRPAALLAARLLVANLVSLAAVGLLEAARLVVAPLQVVINGASSFLLGRFAACEHGGRHGRRDVTLYATWLLVAGTVFGGVLLTLLADVLGRLLIGHTTTQALVFAWVVYLAVWAAALPSVTEAVSRRMSREVFLIRLVDSVLGLGAAVLVLILDAGTAAVPWMMALAGLYSVWRVRNVALRTRPRVESVELSP